MTNTLYLPELREAIADHNTGELREFCTAIHPARAAEFMEGLSAAEAWEVLRHADNETRAQIFSYFDREKQVEIIETAERAEIGRLIADLPPDDRVDILRSVKPEIVEELLPLMPPAERRDILRLRSYPEGTAGAMMTTRFARLPEGLTVKQALDALAAQAEDLETIYYLYIVDGEEHLRGVVSARQLLSALGKPHTLIDQLMDCAVVTVHVIDDQERVAQKVAQYDLQAIPVVDDEHHMLGIITHDDVIDVMREEATEELHRMGAVAPLDTGYLEAPLMTLTWKRGIWLTILFFGAMGTIFTLGNYQQVIDEVPWLVFFIPLVISSGGNSGSQSATLIISALSTGDVGLGDWWRVVRRELLMGLLLGSYLGAIGFTLAAVTAPDWLTAAVVPLTLVLVVTCGTLSGSLLPLVFRRLGLDPAMMSTPFVACICDLLGTLIYMQMAVTVLTLEQR